MAPGWNLENTVGPVTGPSSFRTQPRTTELLPFQHGIAEFPLSQHRRAKLPPSQTGSSLRQREPGGSMLGYREIDDSILGRRGSSEALGWD